MCSGGVLLSEWEEEEEENKNIIEKRYCVWVSVGWSEIVFPSERIKSKI